MFDLIRTTVWPIPEHERLEQPETVVGTLVARIGTLSGRRVERMLLPLLHPGDQPLLGFVGPSAPFWTFDGSCPSVTIVEPQANMRVNIGQNGVRCRFRFRGAIHDLPLEDTTLLARLDWIGSNVLDTKHLEEVVDFRPHRLLVALTKPKLGYCQKVVAALLPKR
jgi:hypothetical protein